MSVFSFWYVRKLCFNNENQGHLALSFITILNYWGLLVYHPIYWVCIGWQSFKLETQMIQSNILDMYRVFPFKLETYMKKSFKIFSPRFLCPCLKPAPFSLTQCYTKQALRTRSCVLQIFVEDTQTTLKVCVLLNHSQVIEKWNNKPKLSVTSLY